MELDWVDIWRNFNIVLALIAGFLLVRRGHALRKWWTFQERSFIHSQFVFVLASLASSVEAIVQDNPFGVRVPLITMALLMTIYAGLRPSERWEREQGRHRMETP